jgi:AbrB family looped-hinge helix DNA binding protein
VLPNFINSFILIFSNADFQKGKNMKTNLIISSRGQLTLPSEIRKKYGLGEGSVVVAEDRGGEIILRPAAVIEVEFYSDEQIQEWVRADAYKDDKERIANNALLKAAPKRS